MCACQLLMMYNEACESCDIAAVGKKGTRDGTFEFTLFFMVMDD